MEVTAKRYERGDWRRLLSTRRGTIIVAGACTLIAAAIIIFALHRYSQSVNAQGQPETVFVATQLIQKGTTGAEIAQARLFHPTQIVAKQVTAGAIADTAAIADKVTTVNIYPGQQLTASDFAKSTDLASQLSSTERALSVPLTQGPGLVGQLQVGDQVDVYGSYLVLNRSGRSVPVTKLLVPDATVLKGGTPPSGSLGSTAATQTTDVVLKVSETAAAKVAFTATNGTIWLALRTPGGSTPSQTQLTTIDSILFGNRPIPSGLGS